LTPDNTSNNFLPPILDAKLKELENEIKLYRVENSKIKNLREQLEKEKKQFQREKIKLLKQIQEEKAINDAKLEEEKQKLVKERILFEKHTKLVMKNPTKEERREIQGLKEQLSEMKEEFSKKESRWGAGQARVRNQVKHLEDDNKKLRGEIELLRKQSKQEFLALKRKTKGN